MIELLKRLFHLILLLTAAFLWFESLKDVNLHSASGLGLVSVAPPQFFIALGILILSFSLLLLRRQLFPFLLLGHYLLLIFALFGTTIIAADLPQDHVPWRHAGFTEYLMRGGVLDGRLEFYFNFPGFFLLSAFVTSVAGFENPIQFIAWTPLFFNLLFIGPIIMILKAGTRNWHWIALSLWIFFLGNWVVQDYFIPQALNYFLYLVALGILLTWFRTSEGQTNLPAKVVKKLSLRLPAISRLYEWFTRADGTNFAPSRAWQRMGLLIILVALMLLTVSSHPLTPWFLLIVVAALVVFNRITPQGLPFLLAILLAFWMSFIAVDYMRSAHADEMVNEVGDISGSINRNVTDRIRGDSEHIFVVYIRLATTAAVWGLATLGVIRNGRSGKWYPAHLLLATVPFSLFLMQPYGGEILLRAYLFTLPAVAFFAASFFYSSAVGAEPGWSKSFVVALISSALAVGFLFSRYGDVKIHTFTTAEFEALQYLYREGEAGTVWVAVTPNLPWKYQDYERYKYKIMSRQARTANIDAFVQVMRDQNFTGAYLILTRSQKIYTDSFLGWEPFAWENFKTELEASDQFEQIFANQDAWIYVLKERDLGTTSQ